MLWILSLIGLIILASAGYAGLSAAPWVPTWKKDFKRIVRLLDLKNNDRFVELGSGTGGVCNYLANNYKAEIYGIELSILPWFISRLKQIIKTNRRATFYLRNMYSVNLSVYNAVYIFVMPESNKKLKIKFENELSKGSRVVSYVWPIPDWVPTLVDKEKGRPDIYLYIV